MFDEDKLEQLENAAISHHEYCARLRRLQLREQGLVGKMLRQIRSAFFQHHDPSTAHALWVEWQRNFRRRNRLNKKTVSKYLLTAADPLQSAEDRADDER